MIKYFQLVGLRPPSFVHEFLYTTLSNNQSGRPRENQVRMAQDLPSLILSFAADQLARTAQMPMLQSCAKNVTSLLHVDLYLLPPAYPKIPPPNTPPSLYPHAPRAV